MVSGFKNVSSKSFSKEKWKNDKSTRFFFFFFFHGSGNENGWRRSAQASGSTKKQRLVRRLSFELNGIWHGNKEKALASDYGNYRKKRRN